MLSIHLCIISLCVCMVFMKKGYCHIDGKVYTSNFCPGPEIVCPRFSEFQNNSVNSWTCPRVTGPRNTFIWVWNMKNLEIRFHISQTLKKISKMCTKKLCRMAVTLFQTSSCGSILRRNRFGRTLKQKHCKNVVMC